MATESGLATPVPKAMYGRKRDAAVDLTLILHSGQPKQDPPELYHSLAKSGATKFPCLRDAVCDSRKILLHISTDL